MGERPGESPASGDAVIPREVAPYSARRATLTTSKLLLEPWTPIVRLLRARTKAIATFRPFPAT